MQLIPVWKTVQLWHFVLHIKQKICYSLFVPSGYHPDNGRFVVSDDITEVASTTSEVYNFTSSCDR